MNKHIIVDMEQYDGKIHIKYCFANSESEHLVVNNLYEIEDLYSEFVNYFDSDNAVLKIGDKVKVADNGCVCSNYTIWIEKNLDLTNKDQRLYAFQYAYDDDLGYTDYTELSNTDDGCAVDDLFIVVAIEKEVPIEYCMIQSLTTHKTYIFDMKGLVKI